MRGAVIRLTRRNASLALLLLTVTLALGSCGGDADDSAATQPASDESPPAYTPRPPPPPDPDIYAAIANINPFGDACAGSEYEHVAEERVAELREAGFLSSIHPSGEYEEYYSGGYCVEAGRSKSRGKMEALISQLEGSNIAAQMLTVD